MREAYQEEQSLMKKIVKRIILYAAISVFIFLGISFWTAKNFPEAPPMAEMTPLYSEHYSLASSWPFFYKYYLFRPDNYDPNTKYPLVLLLHGQSRHMYGGSYILREPTRSKHPAFVVVPIAPAGMEWGNPGHHDRTIASALAIDAIKDVQSDYSIDSGRIYVSGYSMGGSGTFAMVEDYPDIFAAALALCGSWDTNRAKDFPSNVPIAVAYGSQDAAESGRDMVNALTKNGKKAYFIEYPNVGHNVWDYVYADPQKWDWLFSIKK